MKRLTDEKIIEALLVSGSIKDAANTLGVTQKTVYSRMKNPAFVELYRGARHSVLQSATLRLQSNIATAADTLIAIMTNTNVANQTRVAAAAAVLQYAKSFTEEIDLSERVLELEKLI